MSKICRFSDICSHFLFQSRLEAAKDDYRIRCEELEKELLDVKSQNEELTSLADEAQSLKDEMDVLRYGGRVQNSASKFNKITQVKETKNVTI